MAAVGDEITYTICITNTGDVKLVNISVNDNILGNLSGSFVDSLEPGDSDEQTFPYTIASAQPNPLVNTALCTLTPRADQTGTRGKQGQGDRSLVPPALR